MKRNIVWIGAITGILFFLACSGGDEPAARANGYEPELKTRGDSLFHDIMEGHDYGMARMGIMSKYMHLTQVGLDSLEKLPIEKVDVLYRKDLERLRQQLTDAEDAMNGWMDGFQADSAKDNTRLREQYLESEKAKVEKMKAAIAGSLAHADSLFNKQ